MALAILFFLAPPKVDVVPFTQPSFDYSFSLPLHHHRCPSQRGSPASPTLPRQTGLPQGELAARDNTADLHYHVGEDEDGSEMSLMSLSLRQPQQQQQQHPLCCVTLIYGATAVVVANAIEQAKREAALAREGHGNRGKEGRLSLSRTPPKQNSPTRRHHHMRLDPYTLGDSAAARETSLLSEESGGALTNNTFTAAMYEYDAVPASASTSSGKSRQRRGEEEGPAGGRRGIGGSEEGTMVFHHSRDSSYASNATAEQRQWRRGDGDTETSAPLPLSVSQDDFGPEGGSGPMTATGRPIFVDVGDLIASPIGGQPPPPPPPPQQQQQQLTTAATITIMPEVLVLSDHDAEEHSPTEREHWRERGSSGADGGREATSPVSSAAAAMDMSNGSGSGSGGTAAKANANGSAVTESKGAAGKGLAAEAFLSPSSCAAAASEGHGADKPIDPCRDVLAPIMDSHHFPEGLSIPVTLHYARIGDSLYAITEVVDRTFVQYRERRVLNPNKAATAATENGGAAGSGRDMGLGQSGNADTDTDDVGDDPEPSSLRPLSLSFHSVFDIFDESPMLRQQQREQAAGQRHRAPSRRHAAVSTRGFGDLTYSFAVPAAPPEPGRQRQLVRMCWRCLSAEARAVFLPCGHYAVCEGCAEDLSDCCVCKTKVLAVVVLDDETPS